MKAFDENCLNLQRTKKMSWIFLDFSLFLSTFKLEYSTNDNDNEKNIKKGLQKINFYLA